MTPSFPPRPSSDLLTKSDRNGRLARLAPGLGNWAGDTGNKLTRPVLEAAAGVHREAELPQFHGKTFVLRAKQNPPAVNTEAPARGRKVARSEERRGGKECVSTCRSRGWPIQ